MNFKINLPMGAQMKIPYSALKESVQLLQLSSQDSLVFALRKQVSLELFLLS